jgi:hypothetical protein
MATKKRAAAKKKRTSSTKVKRIITPPKPFQTCVDQCYSNLKRCLERNPNNAHACLLKFNACVIGCVGPVLRP